MQENKIKSRGEADADDQEQDKGQGPLAQQPPKSSFIFPALGFSLFGRFFPVLF